VRTLLAFLVMVPLAAPIPIASQVEPSPRVNAVFLEILGNGELSSFNYERRVTETSGLGLGFASWESEGLFSDNRLSLSRRPGGRYPAFRSPSPTRGDAGATAGRWAAACCWVVPGRPCC